MHKLCQSGLRWLWIAILVVAVDRITKTIMVQSLVAYTAKPIFSFFDLTLAYNRGAAFSFLSSESGWQGWLFGSIALLVSAAIMIALSRLASTQRWLSIALSLIVGGALGNVWDRFIYGYVIDFLHFHIGGLYWPAFNVADSAICVGAVMLVFDAVFFKKSK